MVKKHMAVFGLAIFFAATTAASAQDAKTVLNATLKAMGAENLNTIQYSAAGSHEGARVKSYKRDIDLNASASRIQSVRVQNNADQSSTQTLLPTSPWETQHEIWLPPFAFLKGAMANNATVKEETLFGEKYKVVSFTLQDKHKVNGYIDEKNMIYKVETWITDAIRVESIYRDYKDFGGVKFPTIIIQKKNNENAWILIVDDVKPNAPVSIQASK